MAPPHAFLASSWMAQKSSRNSFRFFTAALKVYFAAQSPLSPISGEWMVATS